MRTDCSAGWVTYCGRRNKRLSSQGVRVTIGSTRPDPIPHLLGWDEPPQPSPLHETDFDVYYRSLLLVLLL